MGTTIQVQILDKAIFISHSTNTLVKGMHPTILSPTKGSLILVWQPG